MNEAETSAEHIEPALSVAGWGVGADSRVRREYPIAPGRIEGNCRRGKALTADYVLEYRNARLAVIEAKAWDRLLADGVAQAKDYAGKLVIRFAYASNGQAKYAIDMQTGERDGEPARRPRILFLADRNILADQAFNAFSAFPEDARIDPTDIRKKGRVPKNGSIFFRIFRTFTSGPPKDGMPSPGGLPQEGPPSAYFGEYPADFFGFTVIDECHRGGANDESYWPRLKYHAIADAAAELGEPEFIRKMFIGFQKYLYQPRAGS